MSRFSRGIDRRDAKQLSKNRFARLDADITSAYDDEDDSPAVKCVPISRNGGTVSRVINRLAGGVLHGRNSKKKDQQVMRGAAGASKNAEMVFKIRIPQGRKYTIAWVMRQLHQQVEELKPLLIAYTQKGDIEFLLKSEESAEALRAISRRIVHKNTGDRVTILSDKIVAPWNKLNKTEVEVINAVVDSRFNYDSRALDLSEFALDPKFKERDLHMMLNKNNVMLTAIDRIDEKYGTITALSLQGNRLRFLDYAAVLTSVTKFVKVLDLSNNQIDKISELDKLKGLPVETLFFEGNPLCEQLTNATAYLSAIHQVFPRVTCLDGTPVQAAPHVPTLEDEETTNEPPTRPGFYSNDNLRILVERFLVEFFKQYDGENAAVTRKNLMAAYDADNSMFTLTIANMRDSQLVRYPNDACYGSYIRSSHNILQEEKWSRNRGSRVFKGSMDIAVALSKLPTTNHYTESFVVDVHLITNMLLGFTVQGLFEDGTLVKSGEVPTLNFFSRSFIVSPRENDSVAVVSDMLYISAITSDRVARYKMQLNKANSMGSAIAPVSNSLDQMIHTAQSMGDLGVTSGEPSIDIKRQMVEQFCRDSGMLSEWSEKCLADCAWNYEAAGQAFLENKAIIPKEAFSNPQ